MEPLNGPRKFPSRLIVLFVFVSVGTLAFADPGINGPKSGTVLIIRHGEKPPKGDQSPLLSPDGETRAQKYVNYFKGLTIDGKSATPGFVFATKQSKDSDRPWLTVKPVVSTLTLPHDHQIKNEEFPKVVSLLKGGSYDNKTVLVCWHHGNIPALVDALGANHKALFGQEEWPKEVFGWIVELQFDEAGRLKSSAVVNEHLMNGDETPPTSTK